MRPATRCTLSFNRRRSRENWCSSRRCGASMWAPQRFAGNKKPKSWIGRKRRSEQPCVGHQDGEEEDGFRAKATGCVLAASAPILPRGSLLAGQYFCVFFDRSV